MGEEEKHDHYSTECCLHDNNILELLGTAGGLGRLFGTPNEIYFY